jgi:hypothetical protein
MENVCRKSFTRYATTMVILLALYAVALVVSLRWLKAGVAGPWTYLVGSPWAVVQYCRTMDELQLRMQLEALAFGFAAAAMATFTYGFLQNAGLPEVSWVWVWPVMGVCWLVGGLVARWRYG